MSVEIAIEAQGRLLALAARYKVRPAGGGRRGVITEFSAGSRRRLLQKIARLDARVRTTFITLTYPDPYPDAETAKSHLRALLERIRRRVPECSGIWRIEYQIPRGAPHFHLLMFNLPYIDHATLKCWWQEIIGVVDSVVVFVRIELVKTWRGVMSYASKYVAKRADATLFNPLAYLHAGRWWGVFNAKAMPYAVRQRIAVKLHSFKRFYAAKDLMRSVWVEMPIDKGKGASIFSDLAYVLFHQIVSEIIGGPGQ